MQKQTKTKAIKLGKVIPFGVFLLFVTHSIGKVLSYSLQNPIKNIICCPE
jgi:hypothetical protein